MIRVVHPGSGSWLFTIPDPGSKGQKGIGSRIRIRNTAIFFNLYKQCCEAGYGSVAFWPPGSGSISTRYWSGSGSYYHQAKIVWKALISIALRLLHNIIIPDSQNIIIMFLKYFVIIRSETWLNSFWIYINQNLFAVRVRYWWIQCHSTVIRL